MRSSWLSAAVVIIVACSATVVTEVRHDGGPEVRLDAGTVVPPDAGTAVRPDASTPVPPDAGPVGLFPATAPWYQRVDGAPLAGDSAVRIRAWEAAGGFGGGALRIDFSPVVLDAGPEVAPQAFIQTDDFYSPDCDALPVPLPLGGRVEGNEGYACLDGGDCHLLVRQGRWLYEQWRVDVTGRGYAGGCLARWDLTRDYWSSGGVGRGAQCTSADAAGLPITPLLFTVDEVLTGEIAHAVRLILPRNRIAAGQYVWPASHGTPQASGTALAYGTRLRLRGDYDLFSLPPPSQVLAVAMQRYGLFLADEGTIALTGAADIRWATTLGTRDLAALTPADFEVVSDGPAVPLTLDCVRAP